MHIKNGKKLAYIKNSNTGGTDQVQCTSLNGWALCTVGPVIREMEMAFICHVYWHTERRSCTTHARRRFCYIFGSAGRGSAWARNPLLLSCSFNPEGGAHYVSRVPLPLFIPRPSLADGVAVYSQQPVRREGKVCNREKPQDGYTCASTVTDGCICPCGLCVG